MERAAGTQGTGLTFSHRAEKPPAEQQGRAVQGPIGEKNSAAGRGARGPTQVVAGAEGVLRAERFKSRHVGEEVGLLLLQGHRPAQRVLEATRAPVAIPAGQDQATWAALLEEVQVRLAQTRTIDQEARTALQIRGLQPPGRTAQRFAVGGKQPEMLQHLAGRAPIRQRLCKDQTGCSRLGFLLTHDRAHPLDHL